MYFNSLVFFCFLPVVFIATWAIPNSRIRTQNLLLIAASYVFYGWWDWRFLSLIVLSSAVDFVICRALANSSDTGRRKLLLALSLVVNFGVLGLFKYADWFLGSLGSSLEAVGISAEFARLDIVLPVGISFYTFQTVSYTVDVYRKKLEPTSDPIAFFAYVAFFPQLVAGPIERATNLLPQFLKRRSFSLETAVDGLRLMLWGLLKKVVIADNCAALANAIFADPAGFSGSTLFLGAVYFAFQIYGDFSGYSDIARGIGKLFGIELMVNFRVPYFSRDIAEFWRRWHISLSSWFREYLYIPLGGSRGSQWTTIRNVLIIFVVSGVWHGANWTFVIWGLLNGLYFLPYILLKRNRANLDTVAASRWYPNLREILGMAITFAATCLAWIFFRAETVGDALVYLQHMAAPDLLSMPTSRSFLPAIALFTLFEWWHRHNQNPLANISSRRPIRWLVYLLACFLIVFFGSPQKNAFIYFQF